MKPSAATFSRAEPVKKTDIWRCFKRNLSGFSKVQVDEAHSIIGKNAPRYLERKGYLIKDCTPEGDYYLLTLMGEGWLISGIRAYAKNHPSAQESIAFFPDKLPTARRVIRKR